MGSQVEKTENQEKIMLRYRTGPTKTYQCEAVFELGFIGLVSAAKAKEMLLLRHEGEPMFTLA